ncbi:hypothetical protein IT882_10365 [Microbacterium schleiferi]|uniref:Uncharacterized protein n=1 Tax=Microbacterium schleiferi TaxID=69362 RepID=A0A7S8MVG5_9MICO|nr:hypothetical protein [Microbacterium schleiferi]QPE03698.1 hypothetical protein IT882_10365 [Microbacterium schleiferi]
MGGSERFGQRRRHARTGGDLTRVDAVAGDEARDHGGVFAQRHFSEELGRGIGQQRPHARCERAQRPRVSTHGVGRLRIGSHTDDDMGAGVQGRSNGIHPTRGVLGQGCDGDDVGIRRDGRDSRG